MFRRLCFLHVFSVDPAALAHGACICIAERIDRCSQRRLHDVKQA